MKYTNHRRSAAFFMLALIIWYEIGFQLIHRLEDLACIARHSPSLEYGVFVDLSKIHPLAKVYAKCSFPSGHAMIFGYFGALSQVLFPRHLRQRYFILSLLCCLPRLVAGAHSVSDILAGYALGVSLWMSFLALYETMGEFQNYQRKPCTPAFSSEQLDNHFTY
jgi:membrane-associated phospholipid phosphatase